jgi:hypothetical protein
MDRSLAGLRNFAAFCRERGGLAAIAPARPVGLPLTSPL